MLTSLVTTLNIAFIRRHNDIANALASLPIAWTDELLFQEAKRIVIAELQHITYSDFLPRVLGHEKMREYGLYPSPEGFEDPYNPDVDPRTTNGFAAAAYRFGHSLVTNFVQQIAPGNSPALTYPLREVVAVPDTLLRPFPGGAADGYARWMARSPKARSDGTLVNDVRNNLLRCSEVPGQGPECNTAGGATRAVDLAALNIQRGRDHGLPSYTKWRYWCSGKRTFSFRPDRAGLGDHSAFEANILRNTYRYIVIALTILKE